MKAFRIILTGLSVSIIGLATQPAYSAEGFAGGKRSVDVMTVNLYMGGDPFQVLALNPSDPAYGSNLVTGVTTVFYEILSSQPDIRLQGLAGEIADRRPDIIAVQEASLIRMQSPGDIMLGGSTPATNVVVDFLGMLVNALEARGESYTVASSVHNLDVEMPMQNLLTGSIDDVRLAPYYHSVCDTVNVPW